MRNLDVNEATKQQWVVAKDEAFPAQQIAAKSDGADLPDNSDTPATVILGGPAVTSSLSDENDVDWIRIDLEPNERARITVTFDNPAGSDFDVQFWDAAGNIFTDNGYDFREFLNPENSTCDLVFSDYFGGSFFIAISGSAAMQYSVTAIPFMDDYTHGYSADDQPLPAGDVIQGSFELEGDQDWINFDATAGVPLIFTLTTETPAAGASYLPLDFAIHDSPNHSVFDSYTADGLIDFDPEYGTYKITFMPEQTGRFAIGLLSYSGMPALDTRYTLSYELAEEVPGDTSTTLSLFPGAAPVSGAIEVAGDSDWYQLNVLTPMTVEFLLTTRGTRYGYNNNEINIYDANGNLVTSFAHPEESPLQDNFFFDTAGTYYIGVQEQAPYGASFVGQYTLTATLQEPGSPVLIDNSMPSFEAPEGAGSGNYIFALLSTLALSSSSLAILAANLTQTYGRIEIQILNRATDATVGTANLAIDAASVTAVSMTLLSDTEFLVVYVSQTWGDIPSEELVAVRMSNSGEVLSTTQLLEITGATYIIRGGGVITNPDGTASIVFASSEPQGEGLPDIYRVAMVDLSASGSVIRTTILAEATHSLDLPKIEIQSDGTRLVSFYDDASGGIDSLHLSAASQSAAPVVLDTRHVDDIPLTQVGDQFADVIYPPGGSHTIRIFDPDLTTIAAEYPVPLLGVASTHYSVKLVPLPDGTLLVLDKTDTGFLLSRLDPYTGYLGETVLLPGADYGSASPLVTLLSETEFAITFVESVDPSNPGPAHLNTLTFSIDPADEPRVDFTLTSGDDHQTGTDYIDIFNGLGGQDFLFGGLGNDQIYGGDGNDTLSGGDGRDYIAGGAGADKLLGGSGSDIFVVGHDSSTDWISDFNPLHDQIEFASSSEATGFESLSFEQVGGDVLIHLPNGGSVRLAGMNLEQIRPEVFIFSTSQAQETKPVDALVAHQNPSLPMPQQFEYFAQNADETTHEHGVEYAWVTETAPHGVDPILISAIAHDDFGWHFS